MTQKQAEYLLQDWGSNLLPEDYCETIYLSIKGIGTKTFRRCCYHDSGDFIFVWTEEESFSINKKNLGEFVVCDNKKSLISIKKVT